jgi:serine protease Do
MKKENLLPVPAFLTIVIVSAVIGAAFGFGGAAVFFGIEQPEQIASQVNYENEDGRQYLVDAVGRVEPAVVSIVVTKDVQTFVRQPTDPFNNFFGEFFGAPLDSQQFESEKREVGGGTGFFVTEDGLLVTNKHVVADEEADYTVLLNNGKKYEAKVVALDPANDIAIVQVDGKGDKFPVAKLGDSENLALGETVVAVGNSLGEFRNTVSVGVVSGLARSVVAGGSSLGLEQLNNVIQTDAAINSGNSGGPLANIYGEVIGMNTAVSTRGENIGFAIPVNEIKFVLDSVAEHGRIVRPFLGVRYVLLDENIATENELPITDGALLVGDNNDPAVVPYSPADEAGLQEGDIIVEVAGKKVSKENTLASLIAKHSVGETIDLKVWRDKKVISQTIELVERK